MNSEHIYIARLKEFLELHDEVLTGNYSWAVKRMSAKNSLDAIHRAFFMSSYYNWEDLSYVCVTSFVVLYNRFPDSELFEPLRSLSVLFSNAGPLPDPLLEEAIVRLQRVKSKGD